MLSCIPFGHIMCYFGFSDGVMVCVTHRYHLSSHGLALAKLLSQLQNDSMAFGCGWIRSGSVQGKQ